MIWKAQLILYSNSHATAIIIYLFQTYTICLICTCERYLTTSLQEKQLHQQNTPIGLRINVLQWCNTLHYCAMS
jgi:hypothetical protein